MQVVAVNPSELFKSLQPIVRKKSRLVLVMAAKGGRLVVADAKYRAVAAEMPCTGDWKGTAEINGSQLMRLIETFTEHELILISKEEEFVVIKGGTATLNLKRFDPLDKQKTKRQPLPHKGKVKHAPAPTKKRAEYNDTWPFSARIPLSKEAYKDRPDDWDKE